MNEKKTSRSEPTNDNIKKVLASTFSYYNQFMENTKAFSKEWNYSKSSGWVQKVFDNKKALFYLKLLTNKFLISLTVRENEREILLNDIEIDFHKEQLKQAKKYSEGYAMRFSVTDKESFSGTILFIKKIIVLRKKKEPQPFPSRPITKRRILILPLLFLCYLLFPGCSGGTISMTNDAAFKIFNDKLPSQLEENLSIKEIETNVYLVTHSFPWASNNLVIKFKEGEYLFIDTPYTDEATEQVVQWLSGKDFKKIKITAINTHFHNDRLGGNGYLKKIGAVIYGSDLTVKLLKERGLGNGVLDMLKDSSMQKYYTYWQNVKLTPPDSLFSLKNGLTLSFANESWEVYYPGPGHTQDNIVVYYPKKKILFGGCLIKSMESNSKGFVGDADLTNWYSSAYNVLTKYPDAALVIPGHGKIGGRELITHTMDLVK